MEGIGGRTSFSSGRIKAAAAAADDDDDVKFV